MNRTDPQPRPAARRRSFDTRPVGNDAREDITRLRLVVARLARRLRQVDDGVLPASQLSALATIEREGPLTLGELASIENVRAPTITRIVGALEADGFVTRAAHERDRRATLVVATPAARSELRRVRGQREAWLARRVAELSPDDREHVITALPIFERLLETPS